LRERGCSAGGGEVEVEQHDHGHGHAAAALATEAAAANTGGGGHSGGHQAAAASADESSSHDHGHGAAQRQQAEANQEWHHHGHGHDAEGNCVPLDPEKMSWLWWCALGSPYGNDGFHPFEVTTPANVSVKRLKLRLSGSARKSQKRFQDTPRFKFQAVLARIQPFLSRSVEKRGDQSRLASLGLYINVDRSR
jgi:hypothetical protein